MNNFSSLPRIRGSAEIRRGRDFVPEEVELMQTKVRKLHFRDDPDPRLDHDPLELLLAKAIFDGRNEEMPLALARQLYAMTSSGSGIGAEYVGKRASEILWQEVVSKSKLIPLLEPTIEMAAKAVPVHPGLGEVTFYRPTGEALPVDATDLATADAELLEAHEVKGIVHVSDELDEDSVAVLLSSIRKSLIRDAARTIDRLVLNADVTPGLKNINFWRPNSPLAAFLAQGATSATVVNGEVFSSSSPPFYVTCEEEVMSCTSRDGNVLTVVRGQMETSDVDHAAGEDVFLYGGENIPSNSAFLVGFDGIIHLPLVEATGMKLDVGTLDASKFETVLGLLGEKYGDNPEDLVFILDVGCWKKTVCLPEFQPLNEIEVTVPGQVGSIIGVPILVTSVIRKSNLTGQVDATPASNTKGRFLCVHRSSWRLGFRTSAMVETERNISLGITSLVAKMRLDVVDFGDSSTATHTALGYNVTI